MLSRSHETNVTARRTGGRRKESRRNVDEDQKPHEWRAELIKITIKKIELVLRVWGQS